MITFRLWLENSAGISRQELGRLHTNANAFQVGQYVLLQTMGNTHVGRIGKDQQGIYVDENDQRIYLNQTQGILGIFRPYQKGERVQEGPPANRVGTVTNDNPYGLYVQWDNDPQPSSVNRLNVTPQTNQSTPQTPQAPQMSQAPQTTQGVQAGQVGQGQQTPQASQSQRYVDPDTVARSANATPFFFTDNGQIIAQPNAGGRHDDWLDAENDPNKRRAMYHAFYRGRIDPQRKIVSFWGSDFKGLERLPECLQQLLNQKLVTPNTQVSHPKLYGYTVQQVLQNNLAQNKPNVPDMSSYADDMRKLHTLSPFDPQKQALQNQYRTQVAQKQNPWNAQLQKLGYLAPGQSYRRNWTSEATQ